MTEPSTQTDMFPTTWAMVLGYNNPDDTIECLRSIRASDYPSLEILYMDNGSDPANAARVVAAVDGIHAVRIEENRGPVPGFNGGLAHALRQGADYVISINNDTTFEPDAVSRMIERARAFPKAGAIIPKVNYYDHPDTIWSAGSRMRPFPPAFVMYKTREPDDGRFDNVVQLDAACYCVAMFSREALQEVGLFDETYNFFFEDYDHSLRLRDAGFDVVLAPAAKVYHKISKTSGAGTNKPSFWHAYGRSESVFHRKFGTKHRWATGAVHKAYVMARTLAEGHYYGLKPFWQGVVEGRTTELKPVPAWNDPPEPVKLEPA